MNLQLLTDYNGQLIDGWLMSEKLDGWRIFWDGSNLWTREGKQLNPPAWFVAGLPETSLDGELFAGRGNFNSIQGRIASGWDRLTFEVFDTPQPGTFRQRLKALKSLSLPDHVRVVEHSKVSSTQELVELADAVCDAGGEGVVARDPRAPYQAGRSEKALRWVPQNPRVNRRSA
tara:strand:- start:313 stop:834 length:522 start_codon:yes stop_codon:yes gene_type:complete